MSTPHTRREPHHSHHVCILEKGPAQNLVVKALQVISARVQYSHAVRTSMPLEFAHLTLEAQFRRMTLLMVEEATQVPDKIMRMIGERGWICSTGQIGSTTKVHGLVIYVQHEYLAELIIDTSSKYHEIVFESVERYVHALRLIVAHMMTMHKQCLVREIYKYRACVNEKLQYFVKTGCGMTVNCPRTALFARYISLEIDRQNKRAALLANREALEAFILEQLSAEKRAGTLSYYVDTDDALDLPTLQQRETITHDQASILAQIRDVSEDERLNFQTKLNKIQEELSEPADSTEYQDLMGYIVTTVRSCMPSKVKTIADKTTGVQKQNQAMAQTDGDDSNKPWPLVTFDSTNLAHDLYGWHTRVLSVNFEEEDVVTMLRVMGQGKRRMEDKLRLAFYYNTTLLPCIIAQILTIKISLDSGSDLPIHVIAARNYLERFLSPEHAEGVDVEHTIKMLSRPLRDPFPGYQIFNLAHDVLRRRFFTEFDANTLSFSFWSKQMFEEVLSTDPQAVDGHPSPLNVLRSLVYGLQLFVVALQIAAMEQLNAVTVGGEQEAKLFRAFITAIDMLQPIHREIQYDIPAPQYDPRVFQNTGARVSFPLPDIDETKIKKVSDNAETTYEIAENNLNTVLNLVKTQAAKDVSAFRTYLKQKIETNIEGMFEKRVGDVCRALLRTAALEANANALTIVGYASEAVTKHGHSYTASAKLLDLDMLKAYREKLEQLATFIIAVSVRQSPPITPLTSLLKAARKEIEESLSFLKDLLTDTIYDKLNGRFNPNEKTSLLDRLLNAIERKKTTNKKILAEAYKVHAEIGDLQYLYTQLDDKMRDIEATFYVYLTDKMKDNSGSTIVAESVLDSIINNLVSTKTLFAAPVQGAYKRISGATKGRYSRKMI